MRREKSYDADSIVGSALVAGASIVAFLVVWTVTALMFALERI